MEEQRKEQVSYPLPFQEICSADAKTPLIGRRDSALQRPSSHDTTFVSSKCCCCLPTQCLDSERRKAFLSSTRQTPWPSRGSCVPQQHP